MTNSIASIKNLSHKYTKNWAIKDINFEITEKGILGLLGSNGAGKSTTMNILCGVINQTEGDVFVDGINIRQHPVAAKRLIGFLPQKAPLHLELTVDEYLTYCAFLRDIPSDKVKEAVESAKHKCGIAHFSNRVLSNLSGGYQQRVGIAQAIIHSPKLVVLDEPTNGLDPNQILEVRKLIKEIAQDRSVILSTHILSEVQATCDRIIMIEHGHVVFADTMHAFNNYVEPNSLVINLDNPPSIAELSDISQIKEVVSISEHSFRLIFEDGTQITQHLIALSAARGWGLSEIYLEKSSLDGIFAQLSTVTNKEV
ncbi:ABC transporter ATP-binding protein [Sphingobacterium sp. SYP-B4668]|uniref:ABC transporter ATP-binding protein n=1 Tax=Sphingobacterium sp. SYP-B4668 TaxID=2996035 RepID=UPI0022DCF372|nr:ABC transporter ATP-binding protein [Sphingobacterium sp. SYP-B4668]